MLIKKKIIEQKLKHSLEEGQLPKPSSPEQAVDQLIPKYESRSQIELDPIVEETKVIREIIVEENERYLNYGNENRER